MSCIWLRLLTCAVLFSALAGCGSAVNPTNLGPHELVVAYYASLEKGDTSAARGDLAPSLAGLQDSVDSDFVNLQSLRNVVVGEDQRTGTAGTSFQNYYELREIAVTFDAVYQREITSKSGRQTRFVLVGRASKGSPWQIVSIGSGP
jgi:hypothetical protein